MIPKFAFQQETRPAGAALSDAFSELLDAAIVKARAEEKPRNYLGASRWGHHCERALGYEYRRVPRDAGKGFAGRTYRIFDMGHDGEANLIEYMRLAGFEMTVEGPGGKQIGFAAAKDPETGEPRLAGHIDGMITAGPALPGVTYPLLWETKALGSKSWKDAAANGIEKSKPVYFAQAQVYMAYMDLTNGCLFTCLNRDTGEVYAELIPFRQSAAQEASDRGVRVISAAAPEELPRCASQPTDFRCRFCDWAERCWAAPAATTQPVPAVPAWANLHPQP